MKQAYEQNTSRLKRERFLKTRYNRGSVLVLNEMYIHSAPVFRFQKDKNEAIHRKCEIW